jgi:hypothetical protein
MTRKIIIDTDPQRFSRAVIGLCVALWLQPNMFMAKPVLMGRYFPTL